MLNIICEFHVCFGLIVCILAGVLHGEVYEDISFNCIPSAIYQLHATTLLNFAWNWLIAAALQTRLKVTAEDLATHTPVSTKLNFSHK